MRSMTIVQTSFFLVILVLVVSTSLGYRQLADVPGEKQQDGGVRLSVGSEVDVENDNARDNGTGVGARGYLNTLVAGSVSKTPHQACNIAFIKTHKTGSTTMAMALVRYAGRHNKKLSNFGGSSVITLWNVVDKVKKTGQPVDIMHYHFTGQGFAQSNWKHIKESYKKIMRPKQKINYITILRNHREHYLSHFYYYKQPVLQQSIVEFLEEKKGKDTGMKNPMCAEFGIYTSKQLQEFIRQDLPEFLMVLLTERFDEGLMILRHLLRWDLIDMTYTVLNQTKQGQRKWDGHKLVNVPPFEDLPVWVQDAIDEDTKLDQTLYEAAARLHAKRRGDMQQPIEADLEKFAELQRVVRDYLAENVSSEATPWYADAPYGHGAQFHPF